MSIWSSTENNHSHHHSLFQIHQNKTHSEKFHHKLTECKNFDWHSSRYSTSNKMIHEATDSAAISSDRTAAVWESRNRWIKKTQSDNKIT